MSEEALNKITSFYKKKVQDTVLLVKEVLGKWDDLSSRGTQLANELVNNHLGLIYMAADPFQAEDEEERAEQELSQEIEVQKILQKLRDTLLDMTSQLKRALIQHQQLTRQYHNAVNEHGALIGSAHPLFQTLTFQSCVDNIQELITTMSQDLVMKKTVSENICSSTDRNTLLLYIAAWMTQPLLNKNRVNMLLESFATEFSLAQ